ncbi:hypothetical protein OUZ56_002623 [Daphnia magna]|uniref:Uncharacterized protein n=1 Tax=Daphnia magna TaxID=35525 RepID=A0ABR0A698_9CRUS|nr:hypothetical protein OUZ56_002623 [Daphnia magna]
MNLLLLILLFAITLIASAEEATPVVSMFQSVEATKADTQDPSFELQPGKGQENITEVDSPISAAAEEISRDETNILVPELTNPDTEWAIPDAESLLLAGEASPEPETATSVSEDAHASAESAMELMSLHYVDDEEATSPAAEPIDLYEEETKHSTGEPIHTPEQPTYPIMQPTSLDEGTTLLTATAMATEKITAAAETGILITESTTPAANTIIATAETTAQAERTITPVETTNALKWLFRETTSQVEVMTHSFAELATLKTERIPAVETATVEPTNPVTQETKIVEPTTLAAEATSIDAKTITTTVASFIEQTTRAPETIPAKETVMVAVEQMTPTSPDVKPMTLVSIPANPSTEPELVSTNPIPGTGVTTVNAESLISSTERSVTESTVLAAETMTPAAISVVTKEIIPTMEMTAPVALITNSVVEKTNLTAEQISTGEQTSVVTMDPIRPATLEAEVSRTSEKPAIPSVWPASSYPTETIWGGGSATPSTELVIPSTESVTPAKVPATSTADPATLTVGPTIPAAEPELASPATEPTIPAALPVTSTPESVTPGAPITIAESRTSVMPHSLSADMAIPTVESISTAVKPISSPNEEPTVSALDRTPETIVAIPATQPHIQSVETTTFTLNVVQTSDRIPVSNNTVPGLEQTSSTTEKGPSSIQPEPLITERIPLAESTTSVHSTPPATDMMLLVTDLTTGTYVTSPSAGTIIPVETKTNPIPEATTPSATEPTTFTVKEIMLAAESTTTPANNLPVASSTMSGEKRTTRASKRQTTTASPLRPGLETAKVFDAVLGKITNLASNLRTATESQVKKLKEIWLVFKLYLDTLKNKTTDKSTINATFLLSTPEEVKIWKSLFENFIDKMRNSTGTQVTKIMAAWTALNKFLLSYKGPQTKKPAVIQVKTTSPNKKSTPQTTVNVPVTHVATTRLDNDHGIHIIAAESQPVNSITSRTAAIQQPHKLADQIEKLQNRLKQSTKKQLEKYRESWMVFKFYLDSFSPESRPNRMPVAYTDFTLSTPEEANRNRQMFLDFVTNLRLTTEYRTDTVLEYWQELKNLLDSYQGIDAETNEKSKERNPRSFEARPQSNRKDQSPAVVAEQNKQISIAQPHKDGETKIAVIAKLAKIAYELQRSTSLKLSQFKENWILLKLYLDSLESNSTDATMNYHFLFSNAKEQKYVHELYAGFVQNLRRNPDFPLEQLMQAWQVLNEFLNSYKGVDANYVITSADPDSNHKLDPAHPANAISLTEELAFQKSLIKEIGKLSQLS